MDVFTDAARSNQIHDYSPGNGGSPGHATGLFWTISAPNAVQRNANGVTLKIVDVPVVDAFQLFHSPVVPATLSVTATWTSSGTHVHLSETSNGSTFVFDGVDATLDVSWSGTSQVSLADSTPFTFTSSGATTRNFARFGHERNGSFA